MPNFIFNEHNTELIITKAHLQKGFIDPRCLAEISENVPVLHKIIIGALIMTS